MLTKNKICVSRLDNRSIFLIFLHHMSSPALSKSVYSSWTSRELHMNTWWGTCRWERVRQDEESRVGRHLGKFHYDAFWQTCICLMLRPFRLLAFRFRGCHLVPVLVFYVVRFVIASADFFHLLSSVHSSFLLRETVKLINRQRSNPSSSFICVMGHALLWRNDPDGCLTWGKRRCIPV